MMCGLDGEVVVHNEAGHMFSKCVTAHSPVKNAELNVSQLRTFTARTACADIDVLHAPSSVARRNADMMS